MRKYLAALLIVAVISSIASSQDKEDIGTDAIWQPEIEIMQTIREGCGTLSFPKFGECFAAIMKKSGASPQAIAFTKLIDNMGYLRNFQECGKVDIAYVVYPFRANENQGCLLVNGLPRKVDVDKINNISQKEMKKDAQYIKLSKKFSNVTLWPGDRYGTGYITVEKTPKEGQRFLVKYKLRDGCHACRVIGKASYAFDFDTNGKFLGSKFIRIDSVIDVGTIPNNIAEKDTEKVTEKESKSKEEILNLIKIGKGFTNPADTIRVKAGNEFTITLKSNRTTGYRWELSKPLNPSLLKNKGSEYEVPKDVRPGAGGKEIWKFKALDKGIIEVSFKYIKSSEKKFPPFKNITFIVSIE